MAAAPTGMPCPECEGPMEAGMVVTCASPASRLLTGVTGVRSGSAHLAFQSATTKKITEFGMSRAALRCDACGTVVMPDSDALACFECQTEIPYGASACPKCGWTW